MDLIAVIGWTSKKVPLSFPSLSDFSSYAFSHYKDYINAGQGGYQPVLVRGLTAAEIKLCHKDLIKSVTKNRNK